MKRTLRILIMLILSLSVCMAFAACGGNDGGNGVNNTKGLHYKLSKGEYIVMGYTAEDNFDGKLVIPAEYNGKAVTEIKADAFNSNENITEIIVPASVKKIGTKAFAKMPKLQKLTLPFVGASADAVNADRVAGYLFSTESFDGGISITQSYSDSTSSSSTYYVPKTLSEIAVNPVEDYKLPDYAFDGFKYLDKVTLGDKVTELGAKSLRNCAILTTLDLTNITVIGNYAFDGCEELTSVSLSEKLTFIGDYAFKGLKLTSLTVPDSVEFVGEGAFSEMKKLETVTFGRKWLEIRSYTFKDCSALKTVASAYVTSINGGAFLNCEGLTTATFSNATVKAGAFTGCSDSLNLTAKTQE